MNVPAHLLETGKSVEQKSHPVLDFEGWKVVMLRYHVDLDARRFARTGRHNQTNEVFILSQGEADMVIFENGDTPSSPYVFNMEKNVAYNIPKSVWHTVVMGKGAHIVIFEKSDTSEENSNYFDLDKATIDECKKQFTVNKKKKAKKKKKKPSGKKATKTNGESLELIQQLTLWPEYQ